MRTGMWGVDWIIVMVWYLSIDVVLVALATGRKIQYTVGGFLLTCITHTILIFGLLSMAVPT